MALTIAVVKKRPTPAGEAVVADITFDSSYTTGGLSLTGVDLGFKGEVVHLSARQKGVASRFVEYNPATQKLMCFTALSTEAANASDQSAIVVRVHAIGTRDAA